MIEKDPSTSPTHPAVKENLHNSQLLHHEVGQEKEEAVDSIQLDSGSEEKDERSKSIEQVSTVLLSTRWMDFPWRKVPCKVRGNGWEDRCSLSKGNELR